MTQSGIEPATFRFVAKRPNHCATAVPQNLFLLSLSIHYGSKSQSPINIRSTIYTQVYPQMPCFCGCVHQAAKSNYSFVMYVSPSGRQEHLGSRRMHFHKISYCELFYYNLSQKKNNSTLVIVVPK